MKPCDVCGGEGVQLMGAGRDGAAHVAPRPARVLCAAHFQTWCVFIQANGKNYYNNDHQKTMSRANWERAFGDFVKGRL